MALAKNSLDAAHNVISVKYYTARVSGKLDPGAPARQQVFISALNTVPQIEIHYGNFLFSEKWAYLVKPPKSKPDNYRWNLPPPDLVWVAKTEEKGSDVNLATHLVRDALTNQFEAAVVLSNDTDLCEPIRVVVQEARKPVILLSPYSSNAPINKITGKRPMASRSLQQAASSCRYIHNSNLRKSQFPDIIRLPNGGTILKPPTWI